MYHVNAIVINVRTSRTQTRHYDTLSCVRISAGKLKQFNTVPHFEYGFLYWSDNSNEANITS